MNGVARAERVVDFEEELENMFVEDDGDDEGDD
jgi:hypothetical protein